MTDRKRDPLPEGYQFGDARRETLTALRLERAATVRIPKVWNVMESLHFTTYRDPGDETTT